MNPADGIVPVGDIPATVTAIRLAGLIRDDSVAHSGQLVDAGRDVARFRAIPELALDELQEDMPELLDAILDGGECFSI